MNRMRQFFIVGSMGLVSARNSDGTVLVQTSIKGKTNAVMTTDLDAQFANLKSAVAADIAKFDPISDHESDPIKKAMGAAFGTWTHQTDLHKECIDLLDRLYPIISDSSIIDSMASSVSKQGGDIFSTLKIGAPRLAKVSATIGKRLGLNVTGTPDEWDAAWDEADQELFAEPSVDDISDKTGGEPADNGFASWLGAKDDREESTQQYFRKQQLSAFKELLRTVQGVALDGGSDADDVLIKAMKKWMDDSTQAELKHIKTLKNKWGFRNNFRMGVKFGQATKKWKLPDDAQGLSASIVLSGGTAQTPIPAIAWYLGRNPLYKLNPWIGFDISVSLTLQRPNDAVTVSVAPGSSNDAIAENLKDIITLKGWSAKFSGVGVGVDYNPYQKVSGGWQAAGRGSDWKFDWGKFNFGLKISLDFGAIVKGGLQNPASIVIGYSPPKKLSVGFALPSWGWNPVVQASGEPDKKESLTLSAAIEATASTLTSSDTNFDYLDRLVHKTQYVSDASKAFYDAFDCDGDGDVFEYESGCSSLIGDTLTSAFGRLRR